MKNHLFIWSFFILLALACGEKKGSQSADNQALMKEKAEMHALDSISNELEEVRNDIESTGEELEALLEGLDN